MTSFLGSLIRVLVAMVSVIIALSAAQGPSSSSQSCQTGSFIGSCAYPGLTFVDTFLGMYCLNDMVDIYGYNWTWIDLNMCLTNNDGNLMAKQNGDYSSSCTDCKVSWVPGVTLTCNCWGLSGQSKSQTAIDLNSIIYNTDGSMGCCERLGNKTWVGPPPPRVSH